MKGGKEGEGWREMEKIGSDKVRNPQAGMYYGVLGSLTTVFGLLVGPMIDQFGCRSSLIVGAALSLLSRVGIAFTTSLWTLWICAFIIMPIGSSLMIPVMTLAIKGYTNTSNRGFAFGLFYSVMNVGALASGLMVDAFTLSMGDRLVWGLSPSRCTPDAQTFSSSRVPSYTC